MATVTLEEDELVILGQLLIAFGQGAGTTDVAPEVIALGTREYRPRIHAHAARWHEISTETLRFGRALGRFAAHLAINEGRDRILAEDFQRAWRDIRPLSPCPLCLDDVRR